MVQDGIVDWGDLVDEGNNLNDRYVYDVFLNNLDFNDIIVSSLKDL